MSTHITDVSHFDAVVASSGVVVIDFGAEWCGPCQKLAPDYEAMAASGEVPATFVSVDVDDGAYF